MNSRRVAPWALIALSVALPLSAGGAAEADAPLWGRWSGEQICLDLFANGDFELSVLGRGPKVVVLGTARQRLEPNGDVALDLTVSRIWEARFTGRCRKVHRLGHFKEAQSVLGVRFTQGAEAPVRLTLRRRPGKIELCGEACAPLEVDAPRLGGDWRAPIEVKGAWEPGTIWRLDLESEGRGNIGYRGPKAGPGQPNVYGEATLAHVEADRFRWTLTPNLASPDDVGEGRRILGRPLPMGAPAVFLLRRLPRQRLEVCAEGGRCAVLDREFNAYNHALR